MTPTDQTWHVCIHAQYAKHWLPVRAQCRDEAKDKTRALAQLHTPYRVTLHADPHMPPMFTWNWAPAVA